MPDVDGYLIEGGAVVSDAGQLSVDGYLYDQEAPPVVSLEPPPPPRPRSRAKSELGTDVSVILDADSHWSLISGQPNLARALARRLGTPRGGLFYDPEYGFDIRNYLHLGVTESELGMLGAKIEDECEKDERVESAEARVTLAEGNRSLKVNLTITTAEGPFRLIMAVSEVTVEVLGRRDEVG